MMKDDYNIKIRSIHYGSMPEKQPENQNSNWITMRGETVKRFNSEIMEPVRKHGSTKVTLLLVDNVQSITLEKKSCPNVAHHKQRAKK